MTQKQCPYCMDTITILDGVGYCIMCDDIVIADEVENNEADIDDLPF